MQRNPSTLAAARRRAARCWRLALGTSLLVAWNTQAALYLQDGFNYPPGTLGTNLPWTSPTNLIAVIEGGLTYTNLADTSPAGRAVSVTQGSSPYAIVTLRPLDTTAAGGSVWFSFLIDFSAVTLSSYVMGLLPPSVVLPNGPAFDPCDLYVRSATGGYNLGVRAKNGSTTVFASPVLALNTVHLVVLKYEFTAGRASLYLNPSPGGSEPALADASSTGIAVTSLDRLYLRVSGPLAGSFVADALRVGPTWEEVTPVGNIPPATRLVFTAAPRAGTAGAAMTSTAVQIQNDTGFFVPSNGVPITVTLNTAAFASGTTTVASDAYGRATFDDLVVALPGAYTLTASASDIGAGLAPATSGTLTVGSTNVTEQGHALSAFLDSLEVERYWDNGKSVNWLTGAPGGSGPNMTVGTASHCSAFAAAVACVLDVYLLRQPDALDLNLANNQAVWLVTNQNSGWYAIPRATDAQHLANAGELVVASLKEAVGSGHIAVLRPSAKSDAEILTNGPQECQSGVHNYNSTDVKTGFALHDDALDRVLYYGHAVTSPIGPVNPILGPGWLSNGVFRIEAATIVGRRYKLRCAPDLVSWTDALAFTNSNNSSNFWCATPLSHSPPAGAPRGFYRLLAQ
ncbi:MAG TPA: hypothetical protein P5205_04520 [Candidatus Paceibacterota bacterium]|nr:hypothetical protein [Verrucomicrobiota bacterium]HSA09615.1 hypothetical protein [Candidatus Paceibacterota bacterium]